MLPFRRPAFVRGERLIVDAHIGTSGAEGHTLQCEAHGAMCGIVSGIHQEYFTVGAVLQRFDASILFLREHRLLFPGAGCIALAEVVENVEETSARNATRKQHIAVGQFFYLGFVAVGSGRGVNVAQCLPGASEIIAIHHAVAAGACAECCVKAVIMPNADESTLANTPAPEEQSVDRAESALVKQRINLLGDVDRPAPMMSAVRAVENGHAVGILSCGRTASIDRVSCHTNHHGFVASAVGCDGSIAISAGLAAFHAVAFRQYVFAAPSGAVVVRDAITQVHFSEADVSAAGAIVAHCDELSASVHRNGGNAVRNLSGKGFEQRAFHCVVCGDPRNL